MTKEKPMNAIILGGGFATRLGELTKETPKALLDVGGVVLMWQIVRQLLEQQEAGIIDEIVLVSNNHYFDKFAAWLTTMQLSERIGLINDGADTNPTRLGAIGDIHVVLSRKGWRKDLLVVSSDTLTSMRLEEFIAFFQQKGSAVNAVFDTHDVEIIRRKLGNLLLNDQLRIAQFVEKPEVPISTLTSIPYYLFAAAVVPEILAYVAEFQGRDQKFMDSPGTLLPWLISRVPVYGFLESGYYHDVGTPEALEKVRLASELTENPDAAL